LKDCGLSRSARPPRAFRTVEGVPSRAIGRTVWLAGSRDE
jgi:hypothetical protein